MSSYQRTLETLPAQHPYSPCRIAFLTGLSNPRSCALSKLQRDFLTALELPKSYKLYANFPYLPSEGEENEHLWKASLHNTQQFLSIGLYKEAARRHLQQLANSTEALLLITGSCGLEILNAALTDQVAKKLIHVYALGPVAWRQPTYSCTVMQGSSDYFSKLFFRQVQLCLHDVNHMNYLESRSVFTFINQHLKTLALPKTVLTKETSLA